MRIFLILMSFVMAIPVSLFAAPSDLLVTTMPRKARHEIRLIAPRTLSFSHQISGNTLSLNLNADLDATQLSELPKKTRGWIKQVHAKGGSSYQLIGKKGTSFNVHQDGRTIFINVLQKITAGVKDFPQMVIDDSPSRAELTLIWPDATKVDVEKRDDLYIFSLSKPLENTKIGDLWKDMPRWVNSSSNFYDNFSLKLQEGVQMRVTQMSTQVILSFDYAQVHIDTKKQVTPTPATPAIRMSRYKGQTLLTSERDFEARSQFSKIVGDTKENLDALRWLGDTESHMKRWRRAILVYDHMFSLDPQETGVAFRKAFLYHENGNYVQFHPEFYKVEGQETTSLGKVSGRYILGTHAHIEGAVENRHVCGAQTNDCEGNFKSFTGNRVQGFAKFGYHFDSLDKLEFGLYGAHKNFGGAAAYTIGWKHAETRFGVNAHTTDWNYIQQITTGGNIDSVNIKHTHRFARDRIFFDAFVAYNRFNLYKKCDLGRTTRANGAVNVVVRTKENPTLTLGYGFSGEYVHKLKTKVNALGERFSCVPLVNREAHSVTARSAMYLTDYLFAEAVLGYSFERFSRNHGPIMGLSLIYEPVSTFAMGVRFSREVLNSRGSNRYLNAALGTVTVRF